MRFSLTHSSPPLLPRPCYVTPHGLAISWTEFMGLGVFFLLWVATYIIPNQIFQKRNL